MRLGLSQAKLASRLQTRFTPVVHFVLDQGVKKSIEMTRLINEALGRTASGEEPASEADASDKPAEKEAADQ